MFVNFSTVIIHNIYQDTQRLSSEGKKTFVQECRIVQFGWDTYCCVFNRRSRKCGWRIWTAFFIQDVRILQFDWVTQITLTVGRLLPSSKSFREY